MNSLRVSLAISAALLSLLAPQALAADTTPPKVVPQDPGATDPVRVLRGVPDNVKTLVLSFNQTRDQYLAQQQSLRSKLQQATTADVREQLRQQMQANRQQFLADLQSFRQELRDDLATMKPKVAGDLQRLIKAAEPPHDRHKGH